MKKIFGVDSNLPANTKLTNGYDLYSWVMRMHGFPAFWGRNISGENHITKEEVSFLQKKRCKIALVFNELTEADISKADGTQEALKAIKAINALGVPKHEGIAVFAYIHPDWSVSHNWMISFARVITNHGFIPGFIGNTDSSKNFSFDRQYGHFVHATDAQNNYNAVIWAQEPKFEGEPSEWSPYCPSVCTPEQISLWQTGTITYREKNVNVSYAKDKTALMYMW